MPEGGGFLRPTARIAATRPGAFGGAVIAFQSLRDPNIVVIGLKGAPAAIGWRDLRTRSVALERTYGLPFPRYVERLLAAAPAPR